MVQMVSKNGLPHLNIKSMCTNDIVSICLVCGVSKAFLEARDPSFSLRGLWGDTRVIKNEEWVSYCLQDSLGSS